MALAVGRGIRAAAMTAIGDLARRTIGLHMETVARSIPMLTAGARHQIREATRAASRPAEMGSVIRSRGYNRLVDQRLYSIPPAGRVVVVSALISVVGEGAAAHVVGNGEMMAEIPGVTAMITETDRTLGMSEAESESENATGKGTETGGTDPTLLARGDQPLLL
ncbi:hypothetical protein MFIFM68171_03095 [Madurella fahalii]|uniref:Uncharacterized protein n=1 Tax=Madurella fahalii TaxID=1157608 RepID=A0ABQ0G5N4_9PEZI